MAIFVYMATQQSIKLSIVWYKILRCLLYDRLSSLDLIRQNIQEKEKIDSKWDGWCLENLWRTSVQFFNYLLIQKVRLVLYSPSLLKIKSPALIVQQLISFKLSCWGPHMSYATGGPFFYEGLHLLVTEKQKCEKDDIQMWQHHLLVFFSSFYVVIMLFKSLFL